MCENVVRKLLTNIICIDDDEMQGFIGFIIQFLIFMKISGTKSLPFQGLDQ